MTELVEAEGKVHVVNPVSGGEHTLCGDAFDLASDVDGYTWTPARTKTVTCPNCAQVVREVRKLRTRVA